MNNNFRLLTLALALLCAPLTWGADTRRLTLIDYPGASSTQVWGFNTRGDMAGYYAGADNISHGFLVNGGKFTPINYPGATVTLVNGMNSQGDMVGEFGQTATSPHHAFRLGSDGVFTAYDYPGATVTNFSGINARGDISGTFTAADGSRHAFLLSDGRATKIDYPGASTTGAIGISVLSEVLGAYTLAGVTHGFVWSTTGFTTIDNPNTTTYTNVLGRNSLGDTVGRYLDSAGVSHGYVLSNGQFTNVDCPGATFSGLTAIDPSGNVVGRCIVNAVTHGFAVTNGQAPARYIVTDLGTVGRLPGQPLVLTNNRFITGFVVTESNNSHAVIWDGKGRMTDLGTTGLNSFGFSLNESGMVVGQSETLNPDTGGEDFCGTQPYGLSGGGVTCVPYVWKNGAGRPLGTLGGLNGMAINVNSRGDVVGMAENTTVDPGCPAPQKYQFRPVLWQGGGVEELPMPSSDKNGLAQAINDRGHVVGASGNCVAFTDISGNMLQPFHALFWEAGRMIDLGNLGGKGLINGHSPHVINNNDEIVGSSDIKGDQGTHAFRWTKLGGMQDLGTVTGDTHSIGLGLNDSGVATGVSATADFSAFRAFVWRGGVMTDLNSLIPATSSLYLLTACSINARGEIIGFSADATGDIHGYLAIPLVAGEGDDFVAGARAVQLSPAAKHALRRLVVGR